MRSEVVLIEWQGLGVWIEAYGFPVAVVGITWQHSGEEIALRK